jgi:hypothetical protein
LAATPEKLRWDTPEGGEAFVPPQRRQARSAAPAPPVETLEQVRCLHTVARNVEEHERQRMLRRRPTGNTLSMVTRTHRQPWRPTDAQAATARSLAESDGAFARTHADGTAEVRTIERGALHRYIIDPDGFLELVEVAPSRRDTREVRTYSASAWSCVSGASSRDSPARGLTPFPRCLRRLYVSARYSGSWSRFSGSQQCRVSRLLPASAGNTSVRPAVTRGCPRPESNQRTQFRKELVRAA